MAATANITSGRPYPSFNTETVNTKTNVANTVFITQTQSTTVLTFIPPMLSIPLTTSVTIGY